MRVTKKKQLERNIKWIVKRKKCILMYCASHFYLSSLTERTKTEKSQWEYNQRKKVNWFSLELVNIDRNIDNKNGDLSLRARSFFFAQWFSSLWWYLWLVFMAIVLFCWFGYFFLFKYKNVFFLQYPELGSRFWIPKVLRKWFSLWSKSNFEREREKEDKKKNNEWKAKRIYKDTIKLQFISSICSPMDRKKKPPKIKCA